MDQLVNAARCCRRAVAGSMSSGAGKKIAAESDQTAAIETTYICKSRGHVWRERVPMTEPGLG